MNRIVSFAACVLAAASVLASCQPKVTPDGKCEITSFTLSSAKNAALPNDVKGVIDASAKTITLVIPTSVSATSFIPDFTVTENDVVKVGGAALVSGETSVSLTDGTKISVSDDVSVMSVDYTIAIKPNDEIAELVSICFKQADNSALTADVAPEAITPEMIVRVPGEAFRKELVLTVTAGQNDAIKVNNSDVESGASIKVDTNFPIDITVSDQVAGKSSAYVLKVGKILEYVLSKIGQYTEGTIADFVMTINPADDCPYFAYARKVGDEKYNNISVAKWDGSAFTLVGPTGAADASARAASKPRIAFAPDGTLFLQYYGAEVSNKPTVKKLDSGWTMIGEAGIIPQNGNSSSSYNYPLFVHPASGQPAFFWNGNTKNEASYRVMNYSGFNGTAWSSNVVSGAPALGSGGTANSGMYYASSCVIYDGKVFIGSSFNEFGYYVHEVNADGTLKPIVENFIPAGAPHGLPASLALKGDGQGGLYLMGADRATNTMQIFTVDASAGTLKPFGTGIPVTIGSSGSVTEDAGFAVSPTDQLVVIAYDGAENIPVFEYLDVDGGYQWSKFAAESPVAAKSAYFLEFDSKGNGYIAYQSADGIELYSVGLEADILPE